MDDLHILPNVATPTQALLGGLSLALSSAILLYANGRVFGISGFVHRTFQLSFHLSGLQDLLAFTGLVFGGLLVAIFEQGFYRDQPPSLSFPENTTMSFIKIGVAGFLVGLGSRVYFPFICSRSITQILQLQNGCTSGHMVCGLSRFSKR
jgi:uncharacterized protein